MSNLLVFEIGTEEIPAFPLVKATKQLEELAEAALTEARIEHGEVSTMSTPRRMVLTVKDLAEASTPLMSRQKGPAVAIAFDEDGNPTKAAIGFAKGKGLEVKDLARSEEGGKEYLFAVIEQRSKKTLDVLPALLGKLIEDISWPKSQRWGSLDAHFSRPVRWLMALWDKTIIPVAFADLVADNQTRGHRLLANEEYEISSADDYFETLARAWVIPSAEVRAEKIKKQIAEYEAKTGFVADVPTSTFTEVVNLVEYPTVLMGHFDKEFLEVPSEIITDAMLSHQRYFPMYTKNGRLQNAFLLVSNGARSRSDVIIDGNERVVRPRLKDASFFYYEDKKKPLADYVPGLDKVVFQEKLGTSGDKVRRIEALAAHLAAAAGASEADSADACRAAHVCKADLITSAVVEFPSLQGVMGSYYARESGESEAVAIAVRDQYKPRFAGDELPENFAGKVIAFSDKIDTIVGIFAINQAPTGSSDPFAVRRAAIGCINILLSGVGFTLADAIAYAAANYRGHIEFDEAATIAAVTKFFCGRLEVIARDKGFEPDTVAAVLAAGVIEPSEALARCEALSSARRNAPEAFEDLATAYTRAANLTDASLGSDVNEGLLTERDHALMCAVTQAESGVVRALTLGDYPAAIDCLASLRGPIDDFFRDVLIMDKDAAIRDNRLRLLNRFVEVFATVADIGKLGA